MTFRKYQHVEKIDTAETDGLLTLMLVSGMISTKDCVQDQEIESFHLKRQRWISSICNERC